MTRYYEKDSGTLYRRRDGAALRDAPPDQILWPTGWRSLLVDSRGGRGGSPDPALYFQLTEITEAAARKIARSERLPSGW